MTHQEFLRKLDELLESDTPLTGAERLTDLGSWDSVTVISFMALADEACNVAVTPKDISGCRTVNDLVSLMGETLAG